MNPVRPLLLGLAFVAVAGCAHRGNRRPELDETGGARITRSVCPAVAIPAYTGDVSLFSPEQSRDARALDVTATITNLRTSCDDGGATVRSTATFDVVARRAGAGDARDVVLPYFSTVVRAGSEIMSKQVGQVQVHFDAGKLLGKGSASATAAVSRALATLPANVSSELNRKRKAGDADASIDPMADPKVRGAVNRANFELLIGFQLTQNQLAYNATR